MYNLNDIVRRERCMMLYDKEHDEGTVVETVKLDDCHAHDGNAQMYCKTCTKKGLKQNELCGKT